MGEGRGERSSKRRQRSTSNIDKASSDSELTESRSKANAKGKGKARRKPKERWPFLDGLTVDELARYRRRRVHDQPRDSLGLSTSEKEPGDLLSEYRTAFRGQDTPKVEAVNRRNYPDVGTMDAETESSRFVAHVNPPRRPSPIRRDTSLRYDGQFCMDTETFSSYVPYEGQHRAELARRPTSLKMEGELDTMTEKCEKFIEWLNVTRPSLSRVPTHLRMEGEFEGSSECHEKYVPFVGARRPELLRRSTNLRLEGESSFLPEYLDVFREHSVKERPRLVKPETHLKTGRNMFREGGDSFAKPRAKETVAKLDAKSSGQEERRREREERERREDEMKTLVSKLEDLKGPLEVPEYKDAFKNFPRERPKIVKPEDEIGRADGSKVPSPTHSRFSTKIDQDPEYKSKYLDYPREHRPLYRKPPLALRPTVVSSGRSSAGFGRPAGPENKRFEVGTSEVRAQYVPYGRVPRVETIRMPANLRLEGSLDMEPEYRTAYCGNREYGVGGEARMHRRRDRSLSGSRKKGNYWITGENPDHFRRANATQDQDAFQVLDTRIHEDNLVQKPPTGGRRGSRVRSQSRPIHLDINEPTSLKNRSASPSYRLHVCNVDDEPRGFGRRNSPGRVLSPERSYHDDQTRPYSPSFARAADQPFVVLENAGRDPNRNKGRRRRGLDANYNENSLSMSRGRPRTPTNWMPPWYDSTNTI